jgi:uncharacterized membrane protein
MSRIEETLDVGVPVSTAYNQWTQFEEFPRFMEGVESVQQLDETTLHWVAEFGGTRREWDAKILEQTPDTHISWLSPAHHPSGTVRFDALGQDATRVTLVMEYEPDGAKEKVGDLLGAAKLRVKGDLKRFKEFIESRGTETGAWRGDVSGGEARAS